MAYPNETIACHALSDRVGLERRNLEMQTPVRMPTQTIWKEMGMFAPRGTLHARISRQSWTFPSYVFGWASSATVHIIVSKPRA